MPRLDTEKAVELGVSGFFGNFEALDQVADLGAEDIDFSAVQDDVLAECTFDGKLARLPIGLNLSGIVVNKTLLEK